MKINRTEIEFGENNCIIETGKVAKQAGGAVMVRYGDTEVLVTATASEEPREDIDFTPFSRLRRTLLCCWKNSRWIY